MEKIRILGNKAKGSYRSIGDIGLDSVEKTTFDNNFTINLAIVHYCDWTLLYLIKAYAFMSTLNLTKVFPRQRKSDLGITIPFSNCCILTNL